MRYVPFTIIAVNVVVGSACILKGILEVNPLGLIGFLNWLLALFVLKHEIRKENPKGECVR